jgi:hypothetical protein
LQKFLDLSQWRAVEPGEEVSGEHLSFWKGANGLSVFHWDPSEAEDDRDPSFYSFKYDPEGVHTEHEFWVPLLPDSRPGAVLKFASPVPDDVDPSISTLREGYAIALRDGSWDVTYLSGGRPGWNARSSVQLLREMPKLTDWQLVTPGAGEDS